MKETENKSTIENQLKKEEIKYPLLAIHANGTYKLYLKKGQSLIFDSNQELYDFTLENKLQIGVQLGS